MSLSPVNYKQAVQVAAVAVTVAIVPPVGVYAAIGSIGLGIIGYFGIEFADKVREEMLTAREKRLHCVVPLQNFSPVGREEIVEQVLNRLKIEKNDRLPLYDEFFSESDEKHQEDLEKGYCYGAVSTLFYGVIKLGLSLEQSATTLLPEEVFYRHLVQRLGILNKFKTKNINAEIQKIEDSRNEKRFKNYILFIANCLDVSTQAIVKGLAEFKQYEDELTVLREKKKKYHEDETLLKMIDPLLFLSLKSRKFSPELSHHSYQHIFDEALSSFQQPSEIMGIVRVPKHVIGFCCTSTGHYIYDTAAKEIAGLLRYSDREEFFKKMRDLALNAAPSAEEKEVTIFFHFLNPQGCERQHEFNCRLLQGDAFEFPAGKSEARPDG